MKSNQSSLAYRSPTVLLQGVLVLVGMGVLAFMLVMPHFEGRNAHATTSEIYFKDPFLAYVYLASIPFFMALYHGFKVLGSVGKGTPFSPTGVRSLRIIRFCAITTVGLVAISVVFMIHADPDDRPPGVMIRLLIGVASVIVAAAAATFERTMQKAVDMKAENDLTV